MFLRAVLAVIVLGVAACSSGSSTSATADPAAVTAALERVEAVQNAVQRWSEADTIDQARAAAEEARNLVTGPDTLGAGDLDGDGAALGLGTDGLLPGAGGAPGLAAEVHGCPAVDRDVLGGDWSDASARWDALAGAIDTWSEQDNRFPTFPSHPQRIVGWATLTLRSTSLDDAHEFAGHADLHVDVARTALESCAGS